MRDCPRCVTGHWNPPPPLETRNLSEKKTADRAGRERNGTESGFCNCARQRAGDPTLRRDVMSDQAAPATREVYRRFATRPSSSEAESSRISWDPEFLKALGVESSRPKLDSSSTSMLKKYQLKILVHRTRLPTSHDARRGTERMRPNTAPARLRRKRQNGGEEERAAARARYRSELERIFSRASLITAVEKRTRVGTTLGRLPTAMLRPHTAAARLQGMAEGNRSLQRDVLSVHSPGPQLVPRLYRPPFRTGD